MSIKEEIEETKKQLAALNEEEQDDPKEEEEKEGGDAPENADDVSQEEEKTELKEEKQDDQEEKIRANDFYKIRRERDALQKKLAELEGKAAQPNIQSDNDQSPELAEILEEHRYQRAAQEFMSLEADFAKDLPDYESITNGYKNAVYQSLKVLNPSMPQSQLIQETHREILRRAGNYYNKGLNPVQELYNEAKSLGIQPQAKEPKQEEKPKVNYDKLAANKARNAGTAGAKGMNGGGEITLETAANYSPAEWAKLPKEVKQRLLGNAS